MTWDSVQQLIRILAQLAAGALLSRGLITEEVSTQLVGGILSLATAGWWMYWNIKRPETPTK